MTCGSSAAKPCRATPRQIVLRATVQNRATGSQPPPMIRVTLQDRFGNPLSTTAIAPQDYLRGAAPSRMAPDQRLDAAARRSMIPIARPWASSWTPACPTPHGKLHCSTDP